MEELWTKGEAGVDLDSFSQSPSILEPEHFQFLFLMMGFLNSLGLIVLLWDIITNPKLKFLNIMLSGPFVCLLITFGNLFFFSTAFWIPTHRRQEELRKDKWDIWIATWEKIISTGQYEYDMETLANNNNVAFGILGYGAVTSFIFIFIAMMRSLGNSFPC